MESRNPIFARSAGFNGRANAYGNATYAGNGQSYSGYGTTGYAVPSSADAGTGRMTIDTVVQKTGITLVVLLLAAGATWLLTPDPLVSSRGATLLYGLSAAGAMGAFVLSLVNSFKRVISPGLVVAFAAVEGVFLGATSKVFQAAFGPGVVTGAVVGTIAAFAGTLAAYRVFHIKVGSKFRMWVTGAVFGFVALSLLDFGLHFFGASFGFNGFGTLGLITSALGLALGVLMLVLDFDYVERGIVAGLPERDSWRAAFGLTVSLVWIYIHLLRLLAIFRD